MPRAPGGCHSGRVFVNRLGSIAAREVNSRTASIGEVVGEGGGGFMRVGCVGELAILSVSSGHMGIGD